MQAIVFQRRWRAHGASAATEHLVLTRAQPIPAPSSRADTPFKSRIWGRWRPRFLLCYMSPSRTDGMACQAPSAEKNYAFPLSPSACNHDASYVGAFARE